MINKLSYDTLNDIRDMLINQIHIEQLVNRTGYPKKDRLSQLKNDRTIIENTIQKLYDVRFKEGR